jgi:hypothetical protein
MVRNRVERDESIPDSSINQAQAILGYELIEHGWNNCHRNFMVD